MQLSALLDRANAERIGRQVTGRGGTDRRAAIRTGRMRTLRSAVRGLDVNLRLASERHENFRQGPE